MRRALVLALTVLVAVSAVAATAQAAGWKGYLAPRSVCPNQANASLSAAKKVRAMRCLANWARKKRGLKPLRASTRLDRAGRLKLADESRCDEFSHTACGRPFLSVFRRSGYLDGAGAYAVGENLAWGQGRYGTPRAILLGWLRSDGHRHNLFSRTWRQMGVAYRFDASFAGHANVVLWAQEFGSRS